MNLRNGGISGESGILPSRDRLVLFGGLGAIGLACWAYLYIMAAQMDAMPGMRGAMATPGFGWVFSMWTVMMVAMMLPSALPMIHGYARFSTVRPKIDPRIATALFAMAYFVVWSGYSAAVAVLQLLLADNALLTPTMALSDSRVAAGVLIATGVFQWAGMKEACLHRCRTPIAFLMTEWRDGPGGAFVMGLRHGAYCVGCCWALMALMFVVGVMDVLWALVLTGLVLTEKLVPRGDLFAKALGAVLVAAGGWILTG